MMDFNTIQVGDAETVELGDYFYGPLHKVWVDGMQLPCFIYEHQPTSLQEVCTTKHHFQIANAWNMEGDVVWTYYRDKYGPCHALIPPSHFYRFRGSEYAAEFAIDPNLLPTLEENELIHAFTSEWHKFPAYTRFINEFGGCIMRPSPVNDWNGMHLMSLMMDAIDNEWFEFWHVNRLQVSASYEIDAISIEEEVSDVWLIVKIVSFGSQKGLVVLEGGLDARYALKFGTCIVLTSRVLSERIERYLESTL